MENYVRKLFQKEAVRYLFFGGCTTGVNLAVYSFLRYAGRIPVNPANFVSIVVSVVFAFFGNRFWVFERTDADRGALFQEFLDFSGMRMGTLGIEFFGVWFLVGYTGISDFAGKCLVQILVIVLNYVISKFFVFRKRRAGGVVNE